MIGSRKTNEKLMQQILFLSLTLIHSLIISTSMLIPEKGTFLCPYQHPTTFQLNIKQWDKPSLCCDVISTCSITLMLSFLSLQHYDTLLLMAVLFMKVMLTKLHIMYYRWACLNHQSEAARVNMKTPTLHNQSVLLKVKGKSKNKLILYERALLNEYSDKISKRKSHYWP